MESLTIQQQLFNQLKSILPGHISFVDELSQLLGISPDSVYRRVRGEKPLTVQELKTICEKYHISLDQLLQMNNDAVIFQAPEINIAPASVNDYLRGFIKQLEIFHSFEQKQMLYLCKDMPAWNFYLFPEIAAFKTFVWLKTFMNHPDYVHRKFTLKEHSFQDCFELGRESYRIYNGIPSTEIWTTEIISGTLLQIEYYRDAGIFANKQDMNAVIDSLQLSLDHFQLQAEKGYKFMPGEDAAPTRVPIILYLNEVLLPNNLVLVELNGNRETFIPYNVLNIIRTRDWRFNEITFKYSHTIISRSALISGSGEKERNRFFYRLKEKLNALKI
jgi:BetR domain